MKITDPDGILYDVASLYSSTIGNVRTITKTNRSYSPLATFWYIGKTNQYTGDGINSSLSSTGNGRQGIVDLIDNNTSLTPDVSFALSNDNTLSATGGKLDVRKGQFIETNTARVTLIAAYILGSTGTLYMSPGTLYKIVQGYNTLTTESGSSGGPYIPRMLGSTFAYTLLDRVDRLMQAQVARELGRASRNMGVLATVGASAPFIGLFGTVWGIMNAFTNIAAQQQTNLAVVAPGIAEALFATALGLVAAIPAVIFYNKFTGDLDRFGDRLDTFSDEVAARLSRRLSERG